MELYDEGFETEGYQDFNHQRNGVHPKLRIRTSLFSAIEVGSLCLIPNHFFFFFVLLNFLVI